MYSQIIQTVIIDVLDLLSGTSSRGLSLVSRSLLVLLECRAITEDVVAKVTVVRLRGDVSQLGGVVLWTLEDLLDTGNDALVLGGRQVGLQGGVVIEDDVTSFAGVLAGGDELGYGAVSDGFHVLLALPLSEFRYAGMSIL